MFAQQGETSTGWADVFSFSRTSTDVCLSPLQRSCVAVETMDEYKVQMNIVGEYSVIIGFDTVCWTADVTRCVNKFSSKPRKFS